jgi:hypothetical protein
MDYAKTLKTDIGKMMVLVTGSLRFVGGALHVLEKKPV